MRNLFVITTALLVCACHQSVIQGDYHDISEGCRGMAEAKVATSSDAATKAGRDAELVTVFSDCMAKRGWAVATPKRAKSSGTAKATPAPAPAPAPASAAATTRYQSTQPVTLPAGQQPSYSIYQPAYPAPEPGTTPPAVPPATNTAPRY